MTKFNSARTSNQPRTHTNLNRTEFMNTTIQCNTPGGFVLPSDASPCGEAKVSALNQPMWRFVWMVLLAGLFFLLAGAPTARADQNPPGCSGSGLGILLYTSASDVHVGDTLYYSITVFNGTGTGPVVCDATAIQAFIVTPDGVSHSISLVRTNLTSGQLDYYPNAVSYVIRAQDILPDNTVNGTATDTGVIHQNYTDSEGGGNQGVNTQVSLPCIQISALCSGSVGETGAITFSGSVTNCGNDTLVNVTVTNFVNGGEFQVTFITNLLSGQSATFNGSWVPLIPCSPSTATFQAEGTDQYTASPRTMTATASTTCSDILTPGIVVTKACPIIPAAPGQLLTYSGSVSNAGNVTLTGIVVVDSQPAPNTPVFTLTSLAPGVITNFTGSYLAPASCSVGDTLTATATSTCGVAVTNQANANCPIITTPQITVTELCPVVPTIPGALLTYSGTVTNTGNIALTNIVVLNNLNGATPIFTTLTLAPGVGASFTGSYMTPTNCSTTSTLTASGRSVCGVTITNAVSETCAIVTTPVLNITQSCPLTPTVPGGLLTYSGTVTNAGNITITNVVVLNNLSGGTPVFTALTLAPGVGSSYTGSYLAPANCTATSISTVTGQSVCGAFVTNTVTSTCAITTAPQIAVTQTCPLIPAVPGGLLVYSGTVTNTGNITLTNVVVMNNLSGATPIFTALTLAPGVGSSYTGSYLAPTNCTTTSTSTATGRSVCGVLVTNLASSTCAISTTPALNVTETCPLVPTVPGALLTYSGTVTNVGNITVTNIVVLNNLNGATPIFTALTLAPGVGVSFTGSYMTPTNCSTTSIITASATSTCGLSVTNTATATCAIITTPSLKVTQTCPLVLAVPGGLLTYGGTVTNTGNITITNVTVYNSQSGVIFTSVSLAPGVGASYTGSYLAPTNCSSTSTATATGVSVCGVAVTNAATTTCSIVTTPQMIITESCEVDPAVPGGLLTYGGSISNSGNIFITNVVVLNNQSGGTPVYTTTTLVPSQVVYFIGSYLAPTNCTSTSISTVIGQSICGGSVTNTTSLTCQILTAPAINVTLNCPAIPASPGGLLTYNGTVSNAGNITLTNIIVVSDAPAFNTTVFTVASLAPGVTTNFTGSYVVPPDCCVVWNTVQATGQACNGVMVSAADTSTCSVLSLAQLVVTKVCTPGLLQPGNLLTYSGSVSNAGNITLIEVSVADSAAPGNPPLSGFFDLAPGQSIIYYGSYIVPPDFCGSDTITATGLNVCTYDSVTNSVTTTCPITTTPRIVVTKNCPLLPTPRGGLFTYTGSVSNAGNSSLVNVFVVDDEPTNHTPVIGPITLAPGTFVNFTNSYVAPVCCCLIIDTVTATGQDHCSLSNVTSTATTVCPLLTVPSIAVVPNCPAFPVPVGGQYQFSGYVTNTSNVILTNVWVFGPLGTGNPVLGPINLAPGQAVAYSGSYLVPINTCSVIVTATGQETCGGTYATNSAGCPVATTAMLALTQNCPLVPAVPGGLLTYSGSVSNAGNITLTGVVVLNNLSGAIPVLSATTLVPGASAGFSGSYLAPTNCSVTSISTATGLTLCGNTVTNMVSSTCPIGTTPLIAITQTCPVLPTVPGTLLTYSGTLTNTGNITLTNVVVLNNQSGATPVYTALTLAPGAGASYSGSYLAPTNCTSTSTSTAIGHSICGLAVTNTALTTCAIATSPGLSITETCPAGPVVAGSPVVFSGVVSNTGYTTLLNVLVYSSQPSNTIPVLDLVSLAPGATAPFTGGYIALSGSNQATTTTVLTNSSGTISTNVVTTIASTNTITYATNIVAPTFGTINPVSMALVDRFSAPLGLKGLMFADQNENWGPTLFYAIRTPAVGPDEFDTLSTITPNVGQITDRFPLSTTNYTALTLAAPNVGYGVINFYYTSQAAGGASKFGEIIAQGASASSDLWPVANTGYTGLTFAAVNLGYGDNLFYYVRNDLTGTATFGTIDPTPGGAETDLYTVGTNFDSLVYVSGPVSTWGTSVFAYLRHTSTGSVIGTLDPLTHVATDYMNLGTNRLSDLTYTATDVGYGPNMFYYIRPQLITITTNLVTTFTTNIVTTLITNNVTTYVTNSIISFTPTNTVMAIGLDVCANTTVTAAADCMGPVAHLVVQPSQPLLNYSSLTNGIFTLTLPTQSGQSYILQYKNNLSDPNWTSLQTVPGTGGDLLLTNPLPAGQMTRFYRIMIAP